jgi:hypothetical protein
MPFVPNFVGCNSSRLKKKNQSKERSLKDPCDDSFPSSSTNKLHRWKKCTTMAQRMVDELISDVHELDEEKTKYALCKFWEHDKLSRCLARFCARNEKHLEVT